MRWLFPLTLVLLVALVLAAAHYLFMRWMTRQPATAGEPDPVDRSNGSQLTK